MPKKKPVPVEDLIIPPQDTRICGTICLCQMTLVLSSVAIVYLTVAIYVPSTRALKSGISEDPVMCTTTRAVQVEACDWGSCGEWCLSKTSGACMQIYVNLRHNGSNLLLANCTNTANKTCYGIDQENAKKSRCIADDCKNLTGTFNCTTGMCINITDAFECIFKDTDPPLKCSGRRGKITCIDLNGLYSCNRGTCERIRTPYNCDRRCVDIPTRNKNVILLSGDKVYLSQCQRAIDLDSGEEVWNESQDNIMMSSCYNILNTTRGVVAIDCVNGSLLPNNVLNDLTNFTYLSYLSVFNTVPLDEKRIIAPPEPDLLIANESKLLINLEGCVNTLRDECKEFLRVYGKDGTDHNARARFPCFYSNDNPGVVVARFDLATTTKQFLIASVLPTVLFVVSCLTLILCQRTVVVGDDAKMRFQSCVAGDGETIEKTTSANNMTDRGGGNSIMAL
ncbi:uncharacterized protein Teh3 [Tribolium castaneum]|uniref:Protein tipE-like Protein n=1 Tax=Tribolium castaneum TaxID=7070 RepID=D6W8C4_TRICA|nr:PREDICTED: uncharacterized protein LOC658457 [Tribolium castaneum]EFA10882.1 hypothetical protein TcasGA2_TC001706 [Tribolium castaneum]|eukprot:XP_015834035.1 PREDICTED: uncharacterized protein LOC658457 [Tribolium castaneum]